MTVQEFYSEVGGDYNDIISRLKTDERIIKFAGMFAKDKSYDTLMQSLQEGNAEEAFRAAHTMKGMCQNMSFTKLFESSYAMTEALRGRDIGEAEPHLEKVKEDYKVTIEGINKLLAQ